MCAERAQEHTRTHTARTAGVEGDERWEVAVYILWDTSSKRTTRLPAMVMREKGRWL